ncbi:MAG TPA: PKD domain-containing protein, partial [Bacteroidales bacterium]|nr:PKD domain-containing protein [Bacteroidales bacterium]
GLSGIGNFTVTYRYTTPEGCFAETQATVRVNPIPPADAGPDMAIPGGTSATLNALSVNTTLYSYSWAPAALVVNPTSPSTPTVPLTTSQLFTLTVTDLVTGCQNTDQVAVAVSGGPLVIVVVQASSTNICQGETVNLFVLPTGGSGSYTFAWFNHGSGALLSSSSSFSHAPVANITYRVEVRDTATPAAPPVVGFISVTVEALPVVTLNPFPPVCGNVTNLPLTGASPPGGFYSVPAKNLHGITSVNPMQLGEGFHTITYTVVSGRCRAVASQFLQVLPRPEARFYAQQDFCSMHVVTFLNLSRNTNHHVWQIGTEATLVNPAPPIQYTFPIPTTTRFVPVTLTATNTTTGCVDVRTHMVEIIPVTSASFTINQPAAGCAPYTVNFQQQVSGPVANYFWNFGDGNFSTQPNPVHTFQNFTDSNVTYTVELTIMSENLMCVSRHTMNITVRPFLEAGFTVSPATACSPYSAQLFNISQGLNTTTQWDFGDGSPVLVSNDSMVVHNFVNTTPNTRVFTVRQTVSNAQGCSQTFEQNITVFPQLTSLFSADVIQGCAPLRVNFTNQSYGAATQFFWDFGDGGTTTETNPTHVFQNKTDQTIIYRVGLRATSNDHCSEWYYMDIVVHPEIEANFNFPSGEVCAPTTISMINTSTGNVNQWNWSLTESGITTPIGTTPNIDYLFNNAGPDPRHIIVSLEVTNIQGCRSRKELPLRVNPQVIADFAASTLQGCQPLSVQFTNQSSNSHIWRWDFGDSSSSNLENPQHIFQNLSTTDPLTFRVRLHAESIYQCYDTIAIDIEVLPEVEALFTVENASGCSPFTIDINHFSLGDSLVFWDFGDGTQSTARVPNLSHTYVNNTNAPVQFTLRLRVQSRFGCEDLLEQTITVFPAVVADFTAINEGCHPKQTVFVNNSQNAHFFSWQFGDGSSSLIANPVHTFLNTNHTQTEEFTVRLRSTSVYGCYAETDHIIRVHPVPLARFELSALAGCTPLDLTINNQSQGATSHLWSFGDGTNSASGDSSIIKTYFLPPGSNITTFDINLQVTNNFGCSSEVTQQITLYPQIVADFNVSEISGCHPLTVEFTNLSQGATAYAAYFWDYGNGFSSTQNDSVHQHTFLNHSYNLPVTYTVQLLAMNAAACFDVIDRQITVFPAPFTSFAVSDPDGCSPHAITLQNMSQHANQFIWNFGDGTTYATGGSGPVSHGYVNPAGNSPAQFIVSLTATNNLGCSRVLEQEITVYPEVEAVFSSITEGCHPLTVNFTNQSVGADFLSWDFGQGNFSQLPNPQHVYFNHSYTQTDTFAVTLYAENRWGCFDVRNDSIIVWPRPLSNFDVQERMGCSPFQTEIFNLSQGATQLSWDLSNYQFSGNPQSFTHVWSNSTSSHVNNLLTLTVENDFGCTDYSSQSITVFPEVNFGFTTSDGLVSGCSPFDVQFRNLSQLALIYNWSFGDGNTARGSNPSHRFVNTGTTNAVFRVEVESTSHFGCFASNYLDITVYPSPVANFEANPRVQTYPSRTIMVQNLSNPGTWNFHWNFGDGTNFSTTSTAPLSHTYAPWPPSSMTTRTFTVNLLVENQQCSSSVSRQVTITSPVPEAIFNSPIEGCVPFEVMFENYSRHANRFLWTFGDGKHSVNENPRHVFHEPGYFRVQLVAYGDGGRDTTYRYITVHPNPVADFYIENPLLILPYDQLRISNRSQGGYSFLWDFGDGNTSTEFEPTHQYQTPSHYTVTLIVATNTQPACRDTLSLKNSVLVLDACHVAFPTAFTPQKSGPHGGACDPFNHDPAQTTFQVFYPKLMGLSENNYVLEIYTRWGELIFRSTDPRIGWDGYVNGRLAPLGVYVWRFSGVCINGQPVNKVGDVTLLF